MTGNDNNDGPPMWTLSENNKLNFQNEFNVLHTQAWIE